MLIETRSSNCNGNYNYVPFSSIVVDAARADDDFLPLVTESDESSVL